MKSIVLTLIALFSFTLFLSCEKISTEPEDSPEKSKGSLSFQFQKPANIQNVQFLAYYLTREGYSTISDTIDVSSGTPQTVEVNNVPTGNWTFKLNALDESKIPTYTGFVAVQILAGEVTSAEVTMQPVSGNLVITINWAGNAGNAIYLDGDGDYVLFPQSSNLDALTSTITIEAWYNVSTKNYYNTILSKGPSNFFFQAMGYSSQNPSFFLLDMDFDYQNAINYYGRLVMTKTTLPDKWHHIAFTYDVQTGIVKVYYNGDLLHSTTASKPIKPGTGPLRIGARVYDEYPEYFCGMLDEVRIWSVVRTDDQIKANYKKQLTGNETGLSAYYDFNSALNGVILDKSPNQNNGSFSGDVKLIKSYAF